MLGVNHHIPIKSFVVYSHLLAFVVNLHLLLNIYCYSSLGCHVHDLSVYFRILYGVQSMKSVDLNVKLKYGACRFGCVTMVHKDKSDAKMSVF